jgi:hypothetical protein
VCVVCGGGLCAVARVTESFVLGTGVGTAGVEIGTVGVGRDDGGDAP